MSDINLNDIIDQCLKNDRSAQAKLYEICFDALMKVCIRYFKQREEAMETLNQSYLKILLSLDEFDKGRSFVNWSSSIAIRTCIDEYRKKKRYREQVEILEDYDIVEPLFKPVYNDAIRRMSQEEVDALLAGLSEEERMVFNLFEFEGFTHQEIAKQLGVSDRSSKRYLNKAKEKLRSLLEQKVDSKTKV